MATTTDESLEAFLPGSMIGARYRVVRLLGRGGMGSVYEAENTWTKRRVALKVMRPEVARNAAFAQRFLQEAQAASQLAHPNIVDVLDMAEDPALGVLYIVQEFLTGHDLRAHMKARGRLPVRKALEVIVPVMEALVMAHARGIVHRDLKPDNIFLAETARGIVPKLIDFGIAKVVGDDGDSLQNTGTGMMMGTPSYMAPEQASGDSSLDGRADVWALGLVLYEMLSGARAYEASSANLMFAKILYEDPRALADAAPDLPTDLVGAVMGALRRDRTQRYPTMQSFLDALRGCAVMRDGARAAPTNAPMEETVPGAPVAAHPYWLGKTVPAVTETFAPRVETLPPDPATARLARRRRTWKVAVGSVLFVGLSGLAAAAFHGSTPTVHPASRPAVPSGVPLANHGPSAPAPVGAVASPPPRGNLTPPPATPAAVALQASTHAAANGHRGSRHRPSTDAADPMVVTPSAAPVALPAQAVEPSQTLVVVPQPAAAPAFQPSPPPPVPVAPRVHHRSGELETHEF